MASRALVGTMWASLVGVGALLSVPGCGGEDFSSGSGGNAGASASGGTAASGGSSASGGSAAGGSGGAAASGGSAATGGSSGAGGSGGAQCAGEARCVPKPPSDWTLAQAFVGDTEPPPCDASSKKGGTGPITAPIECATCTCGSVQGTKCNVNSTTAYSLPDCTGTASAYAIKNGECSTNVPTSIKITSVTASGGSCNAGTAGPDTLTPPTYEKSVVACAQMAGATCGQDKICAPKPALGYRPETCVYKEGDASCPNGFPDKTLMYESFVDNRSCSKCDCSAPTGETCAGTVKSFTISSTCSGQLTLNDSFGPNKCYNTAAVASTQISLSSTGGSCQPTGGVVTGSVAPDKPVTICCQQP